MAMDVNGNGINGSGKKSADDEIAFGPFRIQARQFNAFNRLTLLYGISITVFQIWMADPADKADGIMGAVSYGLGGVIEYAITAAVLSLATINIWEATMAYVNPFEAFGSGTVPRFFRKVFTYGKRREAEGYAKGFAEAKAIYAERGDEASEQDGGA